MLANDDPGGHIGEPPCPHSLEVQMWGCGEQSSGSLALQVANESWQIGQRPRRLHRQTMQPSPKQLSRCWTNHPTRNAYGREPQRFPLIVLWIDIWRCCLELIKKPLSNLLRMEYRRCSATRNPQVLPVHSGFFSPRALVFRRSQRFYNNF